MGNQFLKGLQRPAIMPEGSSLPDYSEAQDGDALIIEDGEPAWGAVDALPEIEASDEGKVLAVDQGEAVWADAPSGLPEITNSDEGKVLTVVGEREEVEFIPEQTVTPTASSGTAIAELTNITLLPSDFTNGDVANVSIAVGEETIEFTAEFNSSVAPYNMPAFVNATYGMIIYAGDRWALQIDAYDPLTISATVGVVSDLTAQWATPKATDDSLFSATVTGEPIPFTVPYDTFELEKFLRYYINGNLIPVDWIQENNDQLYIMISENPPSAVVIYYDETLDSLAVKTMAMGEETAPTVDFAIKMPENPFIDAILQNAGYISIMYSVREVMALAKAGYVIPIFIHGTYNSADYYSSGIMNAEYVQSTDTYTFSSTAKVMGDSITFTVNSETGAISGQVGTT